MTKKSANKWQDLGIRMLTISIAAPIFLFLMVKGALWFTALMIAISIVIAIEFTTMLNPEYRLLDQILTIFLFLTILLVIPATAWAIASAVLLVFVLLTSFSAYRKASFSRKLWRCNTLYPVFAAIYSSGALGLILLIRQSPDGLFWILFLFLTNWINDAFALLGGRWLGKTPLAPMISPGKTIEGAAIGIIAGVITGIIFAINGDLPLMVPIIASMSIAVASVAGDLLESKIKRIFQVKDTGSLLPGHGGFIDRLDGMFLAAPTFFVVLSFSGII